MPEIAGKVADTFESSVREHEDGWLSPLGVRSYETRGRDHDEEGDDRIRAGGDKDVVLAGPRDEMVDGLGGSDVLVGGLGADRLSGAPARISSTRWTARAATTGSTGVPAPTSADETGETPPPDARRPLGQVHGSAVWPVPTGTEVLVCRRAARGMSRSKTELTPTEPLVPGVGIG